MMSSNNESRRTQEDSDSLGHTYLPTPIKQKRYRKIMKTFAGND